MEAENIYQINIDDIIPNRFQPRLNFEDKALSELANSIKTHGIIQPLVLRRLGDKYEIIAGERRYKAAGMAGLKTVPAVISNIDDNTSAEVALVENIQRKNLTAIEEAKSFKNLLDKGYLTQDQLAKRMGVSQSAISNKLRLLNLDDEVQDALLSEKISERHARALLALEDKEEQKKWLHKIIRERMPVRQLDIELKKLKQDSEDSAAELPLVNLTPDVEEMKNNATDILFENPSIEQKDESMPSSSFVESTEVPRKFFNFLEDESANLDTSETTTSKPTIENLLANSQSSALEAVEILDIPEINPTETLNYETLPSEQQQSNDFFNDFIPKPSQSLNPYDEIVTFDNTIETPSNENETTTEINVVENKPIQRGFDPISMIDNLDPSYQENLERQNKMDLSDAINLIREDIKTLEKNDLYVETEEIDFDTFYQMTIKIEK